MKKKIIVFRFDFKRKKYLSYGHYFRIVKIVDFLKKKNIEYFFLIKTFEKNYIYKTLKNKIVIQKNEKLFFKNKEIKLDFLFVDLPYKDLNLMKLFNKKKFSCIVYEDKVINFDISDFYFSHNNIKKKCIEKRSIFTGLKYAVPIPKKTIIKNKSKGKVFINFGGSDPEKITDKLLKKIFFLNLKKYTFQINFGPGYPIQDILSIKNKYKNFKNINIFDNLTQKKLSNIRLNSSFSICSGGNILLENLQSNIPSIVIPTSSNELHFSNFLKKKKFIYQIIPKSKIFKIPKLLSEIDDKKMFKIKKKIKNFNKGNIFYNTLSNILKI